MDKDDGDEKSTHRTVYLMPGVREQTLQMESKGSKIPYQHMVEELREKLRISEESRRSLQQKFDAIMQTYKVKEQARYNTLRKRYGAFLEEDKRRQQRNENLLQMLERIDQRSASLAARTERLAVLRKHYEQYLGHIYPSWKVSHHLPIAPPPVKIREYHEEDVSGYGTHTGSSGYVRESERYEEPRMPSMSTPRANIHLYKTDKVLPDKYRIPRVDLDKPTISVTKPDEEKRSFLGVRPSKLESGRFEMSKLPDMASRSMAISPRDRTPREHLSQPEFEVDQNTSGDLLNMSLSDDGVPSLTRSETDAVARHQHWETLRQAYINRQQPAHNEQTSADGSPRDMGWSRQQEKPPEAYDYRTIENEGPLQQEQPTEQVSIERESFRDKIRRLKVMIQENKELEQSIGEPVNGANNDQREKIRERNSSSATDHASQQRVRQSVAEAQGSINPHSREDLYSRQENRGLNSDNNEPGNAFQQQRIRRQSVVDGQGMAIPQSSETGYPRPEERGFVGIGGPTARQTVQRQESVNGEKRMPEGTLRRRMSILPSDQIRTGDPNDYQRTEQRNWAQGPEERFEGDRGYMSEQQRRTQESLMENERQGELQNIQNEPQLQVDRRPELRHHEELNERQDGGERQLYQEEMSRKQSVGSVQVPNMQYTEQNRDYNTNIMSQNATTGFNAEQYPSGKERPEDYNGIQQRNFANEQIREKQPDNFSEPRSSQVINKAHLDQETNRYPEDASSNFRSPDPQSTTNQSDNIGASEKYYQDNTTYGDNREQPPPQSQEQAYNADPNQNYDGQGQTYNYNQGDLKYDYQYETKQSDGNYYPPQQDQGGDDNQEQKSYTQSNEQEYYQDKPYYDQQDQSNPEYDPNQQYSQQYSSQYEDQHQQQYDSQQQQYDPQQQQQQQYDPQQQQQQYDPQQQQQYDSQQEQQQYNPQQEPYDSPQQQYDPQQQQYEGDSYGWQQNSSQQEQPPGGTQEQYPYYGQENQEGYGYDPQNTGRNEYDYPQQNPDESYGKADGNQRETFSSREDEQGNQLREETKNKYYQDISDESTQESDRPREKPMGRNQESPSQRSIDRYRTMLGVDPNSDPAYSEVDEIEDEMAAVVASGTGAGRTQASDNVPPTTANIPSQNLPKTLETNPKQLHDDSSDFDYSSGP